MEPVSVDDEFAILRENAEEFALAFDASLIVRRTAVPLGDGRRLSALVWGAEAAEIVLLHGGGQNAHTWDTVALALRRPLVAVDLPGHGHSDDLASGVTALDGYARDVAVAIEELAPRARAIIGMSAGGLAAVALSEIAPALLRKLVLVDILPNPHPAAAQRIADFLDGPETFDNFDQILSRTVAFNPTRSVSSLRRGVLHNTIQLPDGRWQWRHQHRRRPLDPPSAEEASRQGAYLWGLLSALTVPLMLVRGTESGSVVTDEHALNLSRIQPTARIERVCGAGHSIQGDRPLELAQLLRDFIS
jgi:pimeloyl-ACP methyl ester carboxylesterase